MALDTNKMFQIQSLKNELPNEMLCEKLNVLHMNSYKTIMLSPHVESKIHNEIINEITKK